MPETNLHLELRTALYVSLKDALAGRAAVGSDQFVYWDPTDPKACVSPDVFVRIGAPQDLFSSWKVWERGAPHLAVEVTSRSDSPDVPWEDKLRRYARLGVAELVRFEQANDAEPLRLWDHVDGDLVEREIEAPRAAYSGVLDLWWVVVSHPVLGLVLRLARDPEGPDLLPTPVEALEAERQAREAAEREVASLKDEIERLKGRR